VSIPALEADTLQIVCVYSIRAVGSTDQRAAHFPDDRGTPVARQAGSKDPVRRTVAESTELRPRAINAGLAGIAAFGRTLS